jgi:SPP1 gp7 family putative phage head morphogenesis protein
MPKTLKIGFNVPFVEAISATRQRKIVLPDVYYGELQKIDRQLAFSVANIAKFDQLQFILDSLVSAQEKGQSFATWKKGFIAANVDLGLPKHRLENIYRTNIQNSFNRGHWEKFLKTKEDRPFLMYDAINDSRTRPSHHAMDGIIRPVEDSFWNKNAPSNGFFCRCKLLSLSESQAQRRSGNGKGLNKPIVEEDMQPDKDWEYNPSEDLQKGVKTAVEKRKDKGKLGTALVEKVDSYEEKPEFKEAKTIKEAEKFAVDAGLASRVDYKGLSVEVANEMNKGVLETFEQFPELRTNMQFLGSIQARNKIYTANERQKLTERYKKAGVTGDLEARAKRVVKTPRVNKNWWAVSTGYEGISGISFNKIKGSSKASGELKAQLGLGVKTKWHPEGCDTIKSIVDHEMGHEIDRLVGLRQTERMKTFFANNIRAGHVKDDLSEYARENVAEFIAESWAEFKNNPNPRPLATTVANMMIEAYEEYRKQ